jgi:hypothetical protein
VRCVSLLEGAVHWKDCASFDRTVCSWQMEHLQAKAQTLHHLLYLVYNFGAYYSLVNCSVIRNILHRQMKDFTGKGNVLLCAFRILTYV